MREFRGYEDPSGNMTFYVREEGQDDSQWKRLGEINYDDLSLAPYRVAERLGLEPLLTEAEADRLKVELYWPRH